ncbi:MAG: methyltransferase domain-containing protein [Gammaproteobacteria bacterium]|nr:methyltransferase domain-containing protein [Gammaproteobacteria bacterium]
MARSRHTGAVAFDLDVSEEQLAAMREIDATAWFTQFRFNNASSPVHPNHRLAENNWMKQHMVNDAIRQHVQGKRVLDLFAANGGFAFIAAQFGASEVVGVEYAHDRVASASLIAEVTGLSDRVSFICGDVYKLDEYFSEPFDTVLCLGGLYHVPDPALLLKGIRAVTRETLVLHTAMTLNLPGNWAKFHYRPAATAKEPLAQGGYGAWSFTPECIRHLLRHGGFTVRTEKRPPFFKRRRFNYFQAVCQPV